MDMVNIKNLKPGVYYFPSVDGREDLAGEVEFYGYARCSSTIEALLCLEGYDTDDWVCTDWIAEVCDGTFHITLDSQVFDKYRIKLEMPEGFIERLKIRIF